MEKRKKRDTILYAHIQKKNNKWLESQMKKLGYPETRGKSEFLDDLLTEARTMRPRVLHVD